MPMLRSLLNAKRRQRYRLFKSPGANAIDVSNAIRGKMDELHETSRR